MSLGSEARARICSARSRTPHVYVAGSALERPARSLQGPVPYVDLDRRATQRAFAGGSNALRFLLARRAERYVWRLVDSEGRGAIRAAAS
ncbi:MAG TPA: hypothetical protein VLN49_10430 [Gemmatimonadaceae bacterium]|nr:hypothetical protein [Gemmatimonadaceae bacterium]